MSDYKRPNFNAKWWKNVEEFLEKNPALGFEETDVKQFIKFCVNRTMHQVEEDKEILEEL